MLKGNSTSVSQDTEYCMLKMCCVSNSRISGTNYLKWISACITLGEGLGLNLVLYTKVAQEIFKQVQCTYVGLTRFAIILRNCRQSRQNVGTVCWGEAAEGLLSSPPWMMHASLRRCLPAWDEINMSPVFVWKEECLFFHDTAALLLYFCLGYVVSFVVFSPSSAAAAPSPRPRVHDEWAS